MGTDFVKIFIKQAPENHPNLFHETNKKYNSREDIKFGIVKKNIH